MISNGFCYLHEIFVSKFVAQNIKTIFEVMNYFLFHILLYLIFIIDKLTLDTLH